jgi:hypothetical protein
MAEAEAVGQRRCFRGGGRGDVVRLRLPGGGIHSASGLVSAAAGEEAWHGSPTAEAAGQCGSYRDDCQARFFLLFVSLLSSVEPKTEADKTDTEVVGFVFCKEPIGSGCLETKVCGNRLNRTEFSV